MHQHLYNKQEKNILLVAKKFSLSLLQSGDICWPLSKGANSLPAVFYYYSCVMSCYDSSWEGKWSRFLLPSPQ